MTIDIPGNDAKSVVDGVINSMRTTSFNALLNAPDDVAQETLSEIVRLVQSRGFLAIQGEIEEQENTHKVILISRTIKAQNNFFLNNPKAKQFRVLYRN